MRRGGTLWSVWGVTVESLAVKNLLVDWGKVTLQLPDQKSEKARTSEQMDPDGS